MTAWRPQPVVLEVPAWPWLAGLGAGPARPLSLAEVPAAEIDRLADGHDAVWLMGVWERSPAARRVAREHPELAAEFRRALADLAPADVVGSPYAVHRYRVDPALGGDAGLDVFRRRLAARGLPLLLDFVPNHLALDHPWVAAHPERFVHGAERDLRREPHNWFRGAPGGPVLAHGRDPWFDGWSDTVQLDVRRPDTRAALTAALDAVAGRCDGVRCDMAMLVESAIFTRTWGGCVEPPGAELWAEAIAAVRRRHPGFLLLAEAYWDREAALQAAGFDFTYDKRFYDRLRAADGAAARARLAAGPAPAARMAHFVENHDEERAVVAFGRAGSRAAATAALAAPGLRLTQWGQAEGAEVRLPVQLGRRPAEPPDPGLADFHRRLLAALAAPVFHEGRWEAPAPAAAWPGNPSHERLVAHLWTLGEERRLAVANLGRDPAQCRLPLELPAAAAWRLDDALGPARYTRPAGELAAPGLYLALPAHGCHLFRLRPAAAAG